MNKKVCVLACFLIFCLGFSASALDPANIVEVNLSGTRHEVSFEKLDRNPPIVIAKDDLYPTDQEISKLSLVATMSESLDVKTLTLTVVSASSFILSGELEWRFPSDRTLNMFGKAKSRNIGNGTCEVTVTFLAGLSDLSMFAALPRDEKAVTMTIYSSRGSPKDFEIPDSFFALLLPKGKES